MRIAFTHWNTNRVHAHEVKDRFEFVQQIGAEPRWAVFIDGEFVAYTADAHFVPGWDTDSMIEAAREAVTTNRKAEESYTESYERHPRFGV